MRRISALRAAHHLRHRGVFLGADIHDHQSVFLMRKHLATHLHLSGPTGSGKSRLMLWLFELLCATNRPIVLVDFKGGLYKMARDYAMTHGYAKRLVLFDLSADIVPGYNPLRENGLRIDLQAQWVSEGVKSAWGQATFDQTPQLARMLYLCLYVARAMTISLVEGLDTLRPSPTLRQRALGRVKDPFVHGALLAFDKLNDRRKEELAASTLARLEAFCRDEIVRTVICSPQSLDLETVLTERRILLLNFAKYQPLLPDPLKLLARMFTSDLLAHVYKGHGEGTFDEHHPVYFMVDEVQNMATRQLCDALDEGRGIGLHCILAHQHLAQLTDEDQSGYLLHSVMTDARTKVIFGDLAFEDLEVLAKNVLLDRYSPWPTKNAVGTTARLITTYSQSHSRGMGLAWPTSESEGASASESTGTTQSTTQGISEARTRGTSYGRSFTRGAAHTRATGRAHTTSQSHAHTSMDSESSMHASGQAQGDMDAVGSGVMAGHSAGMSLMYGNYPFTAVIPDAMTMSRAQMASANNHRAHASHTADSSSTAEGFSHGEADTDSYGEADTQSESEAHTTSLSEGINESSTNTFTTSTSSATTEGTTDTITHGTSRATTTGVTPSISEEWSEGTTATIQPLTPEEQTLLHIQTLKSLPKAHFCLKVPGAPAVFCRAPWVDEPTITKKALEAGLQHVHTLPFYTHVEQHQARVIDVEARALPAVETNVLSQHSPALDEEPVFWQTTPIRRPGSRQEKS